MTEAQRWITNRTGRELSELGLRVADILGYKIKDHLMGIRKSGGEL